MSTPNWHFKKLPAGQNHNDSVGGEFFSLEDLKEEALPRESGQNSKDQLVDSEEKLVMKIALYDESENTIEDCIFLKGLFEHSSSERSGIPRHFIPQYNSRFRYLVIEDYNTKGVQGELDFNSIEGNEFQDVYNLFRSLERTGKDQEDSDKMGSWGMGKNMYAQ